MLKKLILLSFMIFATSQTFGSPDNQGEIDKQEALLLSSIKSFDKAELEIAKKYTEILKKLIHVYIDNYSLIVQLEDGDFTPLHIKFQKLAYKIMMFRTHDFIQDIHVKICQLSCIVENEKIDLDYEIVPFFDKDSIYYGAHLTDKMLHEIEKLQNS